MIDLLKITHTSTYASQIHLQLLRPTHRQSGTGGDSDESLANREAPRV